MRRRGARENHSRQKDTAILSLDRERDARVLRIFRRSLYLMRLSLLFHLAMAGAYIPHEQQRHDQLSAMSAAFSRFGAAEGGTLARRDLPDFLRFVVASMNSAAMPPDQVAQRSTELTQKLVAHLPSEGEKPRLSLEDILQATDKILARTEPPMNEDLENERGLLGSKQLKALRKRLERNRLTMPLFDTKGWVKDFEKALKIQCALRRHPCATPSHLCACARACACACVCMCVSLSLTMSPPCFWPFHPQGKSMQTASAPCTSSSRDRIACTERRRS